IRTVYVATAADPAPLAGPLGEDPARLRAHLLDRLIPAAIHSRPPSRDPAEHFRPRRAWDPEQARHHLAYLARLLTANGTRDLAWWQLARNIGVGKPRTGFLLGFVTAVIAWLVIGFVGRLAYGLVFGFEGWFAYNLPRWLTSGFVFGLMFGLVFAFKIRKWSHETPGFTRLRLFGGARRLTGRRGNGFVARFARGGVIGLVLGVVYGLGYGLVVGLEGWLLVALVFGLLTGLVFGLVSGFLSGLAEWLEAPAMAEAASTPLSSLQGDRTVNLVRLIALGLVFGLLIGLLFGLMPGLTPEHALGHTLGDVPRLVFGLVTAFGNALLFGLLSALSVGEHHAWVAYLIATHRLAYRRLLPRDLMAFLDDAHRLGLLRA
ncbi:hypothetical protein AB0P04_43240, partial [Streptomyces anulatus]